MQILPSKSANLDWIHCLGWRLRHDTEDPWTALVTKVKDRDPSSVQNAAKCMAIYVKSLQLKHKHIYVVPIISSGDEQACEDDPSTVFSRTVAEAVGGICVVDALEKQPYSSLHSGRKSAAERDRLVSDTYTCTGFDFPADCTEPLILIVDDIVTRGSTMNDAARAIRAKHGDLQIGGLALAKWQGRQDTNCSNDHLGHLVGEIIFGEIHQLHVAQANGELIAAYEDDIAVESADGDDPLLTLINSELDRAAVIDRNEPVDEHMSQTATLSDDENKGSYEEHGDAKDGFEEEWYDANGYNADGYDKHGYDKHGYDEDGYDREDYDKDGYDNWGYHRSRYNEDGYDSSGYDKSGYDEDGYNEDGYDSSGYDRFGYDEDGYDAEGYNEYGYDNWGYDRSGYNKDGYKTTMRGGDYEGGDGFDNDLGYTWGGTFISGSDDAPDEMD